MLVPDAKAPEGLRVKLLDFGIAKLVQSSGKNTKTHSLLGTPRYMSPEQCRGAGNVDTKTDVYALGVMLFEMLAGRPPFIGEGDGDYIAQHIVAEPPWLATLAPQTPPEVSGLVRVLLVKDKANRPEMAAVRSILTGFLERASQPSRVVDSEPAYEKPTVRMDPPPPRSPSTLGSASAQAMELALPPDARRKRHRLAIGGGLVLVGALSYGYTRFGGGESAPVVHGDAPLRRAAARPSAVRSQAAIPSPPPSTAAAAPMTKPSAPAAAQAPVAAAQAPVKAGARAASTGAAVAAAAPKQGLDAALAATNALFESGSYDRAVKSAYALFHDYPQSTKAASKQGKRAWLIIGLSSCKAKNLAAVNAAYQHLDPAKKQALAYGCHHDGIFLAGGKFSASP